MESRSLPTEQGCAVKICHKQDSIQDLHTAAKISYIAAPSKCSADAFPVCRDER